MSKGGDLEAVWLMTKIARHFLFAITGRGSSLVDSLNLHYRFFYCLILLGSVLFSSASLAERYDYRHGVSYIEPLKYSAEFKHVEYVNPNAPKGGTLRFPELGTFDNFNVMVDKGRRAFGSELLGIRAITTDSLIEPSYDEPASFYGTDKNCFVTVYPLYLSGFC